MSGLLHAHVAIKNLEEMEDRRYHATLEVTTEIMGAHKDFGMMDQFKEMSRAHDLQFRVMQKREHDRLHQVIMDHFAKVELGSPENFLPDFILVPMSEANIDNQEIEKSRRRLHTPGEEFEPD